MTTIRGGQNGTASPSPLAMRGCAAAARRNREYISRQENDVKDRQDTDDDQEEIVRREGRSSEEHGSEARGEEKERAVGKAVCEHEAGGKRCKARRQAWRRPACRSKGCEPKGCEPRPLGEGRDCVRHSGRGVAQDQCAESASGDGASAFDDGGEGRRTRADARSGRAACRAPWRRSAKGRAGDAEVFRCSGPGTPAAPDFKIC